MKDKNVDDLYQEQIKMSLKADTKALMYGRVVNKHARTNLCFDKVAQTANYAKGMGTIIAYDEVTLTSEVKNNLPQWFGHMANDMIAEANYYANPLKNYIGYHGDSERRIVIAYRLGAEMPLHYQWFHQSEPIGHRIELSIRHGDIYVMGEKAVGFDWKKKKIYTLRHAAGAQKLLETKKKTKLPLSKIKILLKTKQDKL